MSEHPVMLPECKTKFELTDQHLKDSGEYRDTVIRHDEKIQGLFKTAQENRELINNIFKKIDTSTKDTARIVTKGVLATVVAIVLALLWTGRYIEKVERLDKIHLQKTQKEEAKNVDSNIGNTKDWMGMAAEVNWRMASSRE
jgi:hypothetical protein